MEEGVVLCRPCLQGYLRTQLARSFTGLQEDIRKNTTSGLVKREIIYREIPLIDFLSRMINICDIIYVCFLVYFFIWIMMYV